MAGKGSGNFDTQTTFSGKSFVGSLTNSGGWQWVNNIGFGSQTTSMSIGGIVSDSYGNSIISGTYSGGEVKF